MIQGGKGRRTPRQREVRVEQETRRNFMREWLQDRLAVAQKRNAAGRRRRPSGSGVTLTMVEIGQEAKRREPVFVVKHSGPNRAERRRLLRTGRLVPVANRPYVNEARDSKPGRRLRVELGNEAQS